MLKSKFLGAAAAFAFVATGVVAHAQEGKAQDEKRQEAPGAAPRPMAAPRAEPGAAMQRKDMPKAVEGERPNEAPKAAEGERPKEAPKAAEGEHRDQKPAAKAAEGERPKDAPKAAEGERRDQKSGAKAAEGERRDQDGAVRKDATRAEGQQPKAAETDKRMAPDAMRQGKNDRRGEPRVNGVKIDRERAVRIGETLRRGERFERPDFEVRVGGRVPESYGIRPLPPEIVEIEPQYRGYDYFLDADDEVVFVSPESHEIVGTIDYDQRAAAVDSPRRARPCPPEE